MRHPSRLAYKAQWLFGALLPMAFIPAVYTFMATADQRDYSRVPVVSTAGLEQGFNQLNRELHAPVGLDASDYYRTVVDFRRFESIQNRFRSENSTGLSSRTQILTTPADMGALSDLQMRYLSHFGNAGMAQAADRMNPWMDKQFASFASTSPAGVESHNGMLLLYGLFASFAFAFMFFIARLKREGMKVIVELFAPQIYLAVLAWPYAVIRYPRYVSPAEQMRRMKRYISGLVATALSIASASAAYAGERKGDGSSGASNTTSVVKARPKPKKPQVTFSVSYGVMSRKIVNAGKVVHDGPVGYLDISASYHNWTVDHWQSRAYSGPTGSDENDFSITKLSTAGKWSITTTIAYYDIQPIGKTHGGDMISPIVVVSRPVGHGVTAFAKSDAYFLTGGAPGRNGFDLAAGAKTSRRVGPVTFDLAASAVYADGPFSFDRGFLARGDATASVPIRQKFRAVLGLKAFAPIMGARDRGPSAAISGGLAVAF